MGEGEGGMNGESDTETYGWPMGISYMTQGAHRHTLLCDELDRWDGGRRREVPEGGDVCVRLWLIRVDVRQKPARYYRTTVLQLKTNFKKCFLFI